MQFGEYKTKTVFVIITDCVPHTLIQVKETLPLSYEDSVSMKKSCSDKVYAMSLVCLYTP